MNRGDAFVIFVAALASYTALTPRSRNRIRAARVASV